MINSAYMRTPLMKIARLGRKLYRRVGSSLPGARPRKEGKSKAKSERVGFQDDVQFFDAEQLAQRSKWRRRLRECGEAKRIEDLRDLHRGRRAFIIGNGPSIKAQDLSKLSGEITFVTNWFANHESYDLIQPKYYCISSHEVFGGWNAKKPRLDPTLRDAILNRNWRAHHFFPIWARDSLLKDKQFSVRRTNFLIFERPKATVLERGRMNWDLSANLDDGMTGIITFCLPLAYHMGIREVYLLGCDCDYGIQKPNDPKSYFYDFAKHTTSTSKFETLSRVWGEGGEIFQIYDIVQREARSQGLKIMNATRGGLLESFERVDFEGLFR